MLGEVVATLRELGLYDETAIFLTADHGDMAGSHGLWNKGAYMYDEIYRVPMLFKPPGGGSVGRVSQPVNLMDVTATMVHLMAGEQVRDIGSGEMDGRSFLPLAEGETDWYKSVNYSEYHGDWYGHYSSRMVTDGRWKLVWNLTDLSELYDLERGPARAEEPVLRPLPQGRARPVHRDSGGGGAPHRRRPDRASLPRRHRGAPRPLPERPAGAAPLTG